MEKETQPESLSAVTIKPEYAPSDYSSEPPPAYHKSQSSAVQVAKIVAVTVVLVSVVLGSFLLASAYVTANASCRQLEQELELLSEAADRFQPPSQPEALIQEGPIPSKRQSDPLETEEPQRNAKDIDNSIDSDSDVSSDSSDRNSDSSQSSESEEEDRTPIHIKLPLQLDFDDLAGALIEKNQRSKMNCIVEKKRAEEVVDHQPKTVRLPFGVNLTTDPRFERLSGERMVILCESGHIQRAQPPPQPQHQPQPEEDQEDTIMIQPVMIPIPHTPFQTHMPQQMQPMVQEPQPMRIPMNPMNQIHPMEAMRPPVPPMMQAQVQMQPQPQPQPQPQGDFPPTMILHHIVQQIIAQKIMESEKAREEEQQQQIQHQQVQQHQLHQQPMQPQQPQPQEVEVEPRPQHRFQVPQNMIGQRIPIPEEVLTQLNRLPNRDVLVAVSEPESDENSQEMRFIQEQRQSATEMNGRQAFARGLPVHIPVSMMPQEPEQEQEPQAVASEEPRPHYVQPRSVRSVDAVLGKDQKRVKRCACDCAC